MNKERYLIAAIEPVGIGASGVFIKTFNGLYPWKWRKSLIAANSVDAAHQIIDYVDNITNSMKAKDYELKEIIVEVTQNDKKETNEIAATRELIGILRYHYENKFKGLFLNDETLKLMNFSVQDDTRKIAVAKAETVMYIHFKEKEKQNHCENARAININLKNK